MPDDIKSKVERALAEPDRLERMRASFRTVLEKREENRPRMGDLSSRMERLAEVRERSVGDDALLGRAIENLEAGGIRVRRVDSAGEAVAAVLEELGAETLLVKSKSNLSKEIDLTSELTRRGVTVVETDIGDRIIQLSGEPAVHPTGPCAQFDRNDVARVLARHLGREVEGEPLSLIREVLADITPYIEEARVGLSGVNAIAADEGALVMMHNEGNVDLVTQRPDKLIVLASREKVYPDIAEAVNMLELEAFHATGQPIAAFVRVIAGPSRTADIEKEIHLGVHGPSDIVVLLIDNGRDKLVADEDLRAALHCIGCGACLLTCPVYDVMGPEYGWQGHLGGLGVVVSPYLGDAGESPMELAAGRGLALCTTCGQCAAECPVSVPTDDMLKVVRARAIESGMSPAQEHVSLLAGVRNYSNPWMQPRARRDSWTKGLELSEPGPGTSLFFAGCSLAYLSKDVAAAAAGLLISSGLRVSTLGKDEVCCGSPVLRLGALDLYEELARENAQRIAESGVDEVITLCPGCMSALKGYADTVPGFDVRVRHVTEVLLEAVERGSLRFEPGGKARITYHDPCHLGRGCGIYDQPRRLLEAVGGVELVEMDRNRERSACCGSGGGVRTAFAELAKEIGRKRCESAAAAGADLIVTSCPWCEQNLIDAMDSAGRRLPVLDICSFLTEKLLLNPES